MYSYKYGNHIALRGHITLSSHAALVPALLTTIDGSLLFT
jgi:hypothetical protein